MAMKSSILFVFFIGIVFANVPSWVQSGVIVNYDGFSASVSQGQYVNPVEVQVEINVASVTENSVSGVTEVTNVLIPGYADSYAFVCYEGQPCDWLFWVDPQNPTESAVGPNGEEYSVAGTTTYSYGTYYSEDATLLTYQNAETGVEYHILYETKTGLILSYAEIYSSQEIYLYFTSINTDLSDYQTPVQQENHGNEEEEDVDNNGQDFENDEQEQPEGQNEENDSQPNNQEEEQGKLCYLSSIVLLGLFIVISHEN